MMDDTDIQIDCNLSDEELDRLLKRMKLGHVRQNSSELLRRCELSSLTPRQTLCYLLGMEEKSRHEKGALLMTKMACFPSPATMENFDFGVSCVNKSLFDELSSCSWIDEKSNILMFGKPGTGKTHLSIALGRQAIERGYSVLFINANELMITLSEADRQGRLEEKVARFLRYRLMIIDEFGFPLSGNKNWAALFYTLMARRHERCSSIITTNKSVRDWPHYLSGDAECTRACLDRLLEHCVRIRFDGESYRLRNLRKSCLRGNKGDSELLEATSLA